MGLSSLPWTVHSPCILPTNARKSEWESKLCCQAPQKDWCSWRAGTWHCCGLSLGVPHWHSNSLTRGWKDSGKLAAVWIKQKERNRKKHLKISFECVYGCVDGICQGACAPRHTCRSKRYTFVELVLVVHFMWIWGVNSGYHLVQQEPLSAEPP